jgi:hypothetical protein
MTVWLVSRNLPSWGRQATKGDYDYEYDYEYEYEYDYDYDQDFT